MELTKKMAHKTPYGMKHAKKKKKKKKKKKTFQKVLHRDRGGFVQK